VVKYAILSFFLAALVGCSSCHSSQKRFDNEKNYVVTQQEALESSVLVEFGIATGSGFIIDTFLNKKGTKRCYKVITASHVTKPEYASPLSKPSIRFTLNGKRITLTGAEITFRDVYADIALLTIWTDNLEQLCLPFRIIEDNSYLKYSTDVYMVSYPQGFGPMLTKGIISGIKIFAWDDKAFTTTAQSAPGSSGGPVIKSDTGEVVGLLKAVVVQPGSPHLFGWQSIVAPASEFRHLVTWGKDSIIIPAGPRGVDANNIIVVFTPTQI